jgi:hypothetical protein
MGRPDEFVSELMLVAGGFLAWIAVRRFRHTGFPRIPTAAAGGIAVLAAVVLVAAFIAPRKLLPVSAVTPAATRPSSTATLSIVKPMDGAHVSGSQLEVALKLNGGQIVSASTTQLTPVTGHIHLSVDGRLVSMTYGLLQPIDLRGLSPGTHTILAEFVAADHAPFNPRVTAAATFVKEG